MPKKIKLGPNAKPHEMLQCGLISVKADLETHSLTLWVPNGHCTDMSGAIAYAQRIDPEVLGIMVMMQIGPSPLRGTFYFFDGNEWQARDIRPEGVRASLRLVRSTPPKLKLLGWDELKEIAEKGLEP